MLMKGKFELLALMETKLKGKGEVSWWGANVIFTGVHEIERAREEVAVLLNDVWHSAMVKYGCVSLSIDWIKFKFSRAKVCVVVGYGPNKGDDEIMKEMMMKGIGSAMTWIGIWIG